MEGTLVSLNALLVGDRLFDIPVFQRSYAWEEKNLQDLWEDLYYLAPSKKHFFGTVLLKDSGATATSGLRTFARLEVIDGQQRLITVLILLRELISQATTVTNDEFREQASTLEENYLKYKAHYKLNPLGSDGDFFHDFVIDDKEFKEENAQTPSQHRLVNAKYFFRNRLREVKDEHPNEFDKFLIELKQRIDGLQLIQYLVNSGADAIRVFETVNNRGRPLSDLEKTKSFLMHASYLGLRDEDDAVETRLKELNKCFAGMYGYFDDISESTYLERFRENDIQRYHFIDYISHQGDLGKYLERLKEYIRDQLRKKPDEAVLFALDYANDLEQAFFAVKDIATTRNTQDDPGKLIDKLFMVGRLGNIFPLLIASWLRFREDTVQMSEILELLERFTFRAYAVGNRRSDTGRSWLNSIAHNVHQRKWDYATLISKLREINNYYQDNEGFKRDLRSDDFYGRLTSREIKYLLSEYEIHLGKMSGEPFTPMQEEILSSPKYQVEHIWPQNKDELKLSEEMTEMHQQNVHRLGNLTITAWNSSLSNKPFEEKRLKYGESSMRVQRDLADLSEWNPDAIREREDKIVEFALKRWSL